MKWLEWLKWSLAVRPAPIERASQGVVAWPSCLPVVFLLALGIVVLELQHRREATVLERAFLLVVAEVATVSFQQAFPWFEMTAVDDRPSSFSPEEKSENPRRQ